MFEVIFLFVLALVFIAFAVLQDLKSREIANWLNWSLIIFALGFRFFWGLFEGEAINLAFGKSLIFSLVFLGIPLLLFYLFEKASSSEIKNKGFTLCTKCAVFIKPGFAPCLSDL